MADISDPFHFFFKERGRTKIDGEPRRITGELRSSRLTACLFQRNVATTNISYRKPDRIETHVRVVGRNDA
jgi:hypothetical protein